MILDENDSNRSSLQLEKKEKSLHQEKARLEENIKTFCPSYNKMSPSPIFEYRNDRQKIQDSEKSTVVCGSAGERERIK